MIRSGVLFLVVFTVSLKTFIKSVRAQGFCGKEYKDALSCSTTCPSGLSSECPDGETCFDVNRCHSSISPSTVPTTYTPMSPAPGNLKYCGVTFEDAKRCKRACPLGYDGQCENGETCYAEVDQCKSDRPNKTLSFCGKNIRDASKCMTACHRNGNSECPGEFCYNVEICRSILPSTTPIPSQQSGLSPIEWTAAILGAVTSVVAVVECIRQLCIRRKKAKTFRDMAILYRSEDDDNDVSP